MLPQFILNGISASKSLIFHSVSHLKLLQRSPQYNCIFSLDYNSEKLEFVFLLKKIILSLSKKIEKSRVFLHRESNSSKNQKYCKWYLIESVCIFNLVMANNKFKKSTHYGCIKTIHWKEMNRFPTRRPNFSKGVAL